jgi:dihydrofolate reductase
MNSMPKYVVSTTLEEATWENTTILRSLDEAAKLRDETEGNIIVAGSNTLDHSLIERDLVDELCLMIFPVILGSGKRIFPELPDKAVFEFADHRQYVSIVVHAYRRQGR